MPEPERDAFGNPLTEGGAATPPSAAVTVDEPAAVPAPAEPDRPRRSPVGVLFLIVALAVTGVVLWRSDRDALDAPQVVARELDGHALAERSLLREANLRRVLALVEEEMRPGEELLSVRITPAEVVTQVRDENGDTRLIDVDLAFAVDARDWSTGTSSTPIDLATIDPAVPQRVVREALRHAGVDDTHLSAISLTGADRPSWYVTLDDVRIGNQSWIADLAGVAVTRPGELPPARGLEGDSLMRAANFAKAMRSVARAGRRVGRLRVEPQRVDADVNGRDGMRSVRVDAAQRVTVDDRPGSLPATIAVSRIQAGALERALTTIARRGVPARRVGYAVLSLPPRVSGIPPSWTIFYERVSAHRRTWRASLDGRTVERVG